MPTPLRLGLAGLGTVGIGVVQIVQRHADLIAARAGRAIVLTAVSSRAIPTRWRALTPPRYSTGCRWCARAAWMIASRIARASRPGPCILRHDV